MCRSLPRGTRPAPAGAARTDIRVALGRGIALPDATAHVAGTRRGRGEDVAPKNGRNQGGLRDGGMEEWKWWGRWDPASPVRRQGRLRVEAAGAATRRLRRTRAPLCSSCALRAGCARRDDACGLCAQGDTCGPFAQSAAGGADARGGGRSALLPGVAIQGQDLPGARAVAQEIPPAFGGSVGAHNVLQHLPVGGVHDHRGLAVHGQGLARKARGTDGGDALGGETRPACQPWPGVRPWARRRGSSARRPRRLRCPRQCCRYARWPRATRTRPRAGARAGSNRRARQGTGPAGAPRADAGRRGGCVAWQRLYSIHRGGSTPCAASENDRTPCHGHHLQAWVPPCPGHNLLSRGTALRPAHCLPSPAGGPWATGAMPYSMDENGDAPRATPSKHPRPLSVRPAP